VALLCNVFASVLLLLLLLLLLQVLFDVQASSIRPGVERSLFTGQVEVRGHIG
jgi:hypothetical protein